MLVICQTCNARVQVEELHNTSDYRGDEDRGEGDSLILARCLSCKGPFLLTQHFEHYDLDTVYDDPVQLYPPIDVAGPVTNRSAIPTTIRTRMQSARRIYTHLGEYEAVVVMVRKALEALALHQGAPANLTLYNMIRWLNEQGKLDLDQALKISRHREFT